jgi:IS30 family transposase
VACYTSRTYDERKRIQWLWEAGVQAKEITDKLSVPLSTIYAELPRGQDGTWLSNMRMRYDADLAQLRLQQSYESWG